MDPAVEDYDLEAVYDAQIAPLMGQILDICKAHRLPMVASFSYSHSEADGHGLCTSHLVFAGRSPAVFTEAVRAIRRPSLLAFTIGPVTRTQPGT